MKYTLVFLTIFVLILSVIQGESLNDESESREYEPHIRDKRQWGWGMRRGWGGMGGMGRWGGMGMYPRWGMGGMGMMNPWMMYG
uniref:Uncharacterized protein n=1 Tax=Strongyloides venezuelensis TaxID=75913 RepID=A0A0K0FDI8_STRVS